MRAYNHKAGLVIPLNRIARYKRMFLMPEAQCSAVQLSRLLIGCVLRKLLRFGHAPQLDGSLTLETDLPAVNVTSVTVIPVVFSRVEVSLRLARPRTPSPRIQTLGTTPKKLFALFCLFFGWPEAPQSPAPKTLTDIVCRCRQKTVLAQG